MKKLKTQFILFFLLLAGTLGFLLFHSYQQIQSEEQRLWETLSENTFNQMQAQISDLLLIEDKRSFSEYRYYYVPESVAQGYALNVSPLANLPQGNDGITGYFQIDPNGKFHTPYLPPNKDQKKVTKLTQRQELQDKLKQLTSSLQVDFSAQTSKDKKGKLAKNFGSIIELGILSKPKIKPVAPSPSSIGRYGISGEGGASDKGSAQKQDTRSAKKKYRSRQKIYPNPLKKLVSYKPEATQEEAETGESLDDLSVAAPSNMAQLQTFQEQKFAPGQFTEPKDRDESDGLSEGFGNKLSIMTDPFRARLVNWTDIIFYRRIWTNQKPYLQGFVVNLSQFYKWALNSSYINTPLPSFTEAQLLWEDRLLANSSSTTLAKHLLFERNLGYPLNQFQWRVKYKSLPPSASRQLFYILTLFLGFLTTIGMYILYRSTSTQVLLSQKRQDFVSAVTHELKTPLTSIRMYSEMLSEGWVENENKKKEYYDLMTKEGDRLGKLIDNVLHMARLEKHNYNFNLVKASPESQFKELTKEFEPWITAQGFEWKTSCASDLPQVSYDPDALKQTLLTLIENGIKFSQSSPKKCIEMHLKQENNQVVWIIQDHGPGVKESELKKIFGQFYRTEDELTRQTKGTGIGLAMAKMLVEGMGGKISAKNTPPQGLTIEIRF